MKAWRNLLAAAIILLSGCAASGQPGPAASAAGDPTLGAEPAAYGPPSNDLDSFFTQVRALRTGRAQQLRIIQLGDSHTAADFFTGQLRDTLQAQLGNAGVGTRAAGIPYAGIRKKDLTLAQDGHWQYHNSLTDHEFTDYGLSGFTAVSRSPGATLSMSPTDPKGFDRGFVDFVRRPAGGTIEVYLDDRLAATASVTGPAGTLGRVAVTAPPGGAHTFRLVAKEPGIEILAWNTERDAPGIILDSFGVVGATVGVIDNWNPNLVRQELALLRPALVILAYGTNEGARTNFDPVAYATDYDQILTNLRHWSPLSSFLIIGPTDGARADRGCTKYAGNSANCQWTTLPALDQVRLIEYQLSQRHHIAFWNSAEPEQRSGGINLWATHDPPLARGDHIHFTPTGYTILANEFFYWLNYRFAAYARAHRLGESAL